LNLVRASVFNLELLDILRDSIRNLIKLLLSFQFSQSFCFQFWASRYITGLNWIVEKKVIVFWICSVLMFSISSVSIYYGTKWDIRVKIYCRLNFLRASTFIFERLDILRDSIRHPRKTLLYLEFAQCLCFQFRGSWYITELNRMSELKRYCHLNLLGASVLNFEHLDIWGDSIRHPSKKFLSLEFAQCLCFQFRASWYITGLNRTTKWKLLSFEFGTSFRFQFGAPRYITGLNRTSE